MAIIECPHCSKRMSERAPTCPFCGKDPKTEPPPPPKQQSPQFLALRQALATGQAMPLPIRIDRAIQQCVQVADAVGLKLDLSPASVYSMDIWLDEFWGTAGAAPDQDEWHPDEKKNNIIVAMGSYIGEVVRRLGDGLWCAHPEQPRHVNFVQVVFPEGGVVWPVGRVFKRFKNGSEDALYPYLKMIRQQIGSSESATEAPDWAIQGAHWRKVKKWQPAITCLDVALRLQPEQPDFHVVRVQALIGAGRHDEAKAELEWCRAHPSEDERMRGLVDELESSLEA